MTMTPKLTSTKPLPSRSSVFTVFFIGFYPSPAAATDVPTTAYTEERIPHLVVRPGMPDIVELARRE
jgi:hypothetical protein